MGQAGVTQERKVEYLIGINAPEGYEQLGRPFVVRVTMIRDDEQKSAQLSIEEAKRGACDLMLTADAFMIGEPYVSAELEGYRVIERRYYPIVPYKRRDAKKR